MMNPLRSSMRQRPKKNKASSFVDEGITFPVHNLRHILFPELIVTNKERDPIDNHVIYSFFVAALFLDDYPLYKHFKDIGILEW